MGVIEPKFILNEVEPDDMDYPDATTKEDMAAALYAECRPPALTEAQMVTMSDALAQAAGTRRLTRMWAKYAVGPRKGERVMVLAAVEQKKLPDGSVATMATPLVEVLTSEPFTTIVADGDVNPPADAPRIILPDHVRRY